VSTNISSVDCTVNGGCLATAAAVNGVQLDAPSTTLTPRTNQVDFGLSKRMKFGRLRVDPKFDLFNLFNSSDYYSVRSTTFSPILNTSVSDPTHAPALPSLASGTNYTNYLSPARFLQGRILNLGLSVSDARNSSIASGRRFASSSVLPRS